MITACVNNVKRYGTGSLSQEASPGADLPSPESRLGYRVCAFRLG